jgi:hypothetical protein
MGNLGGRIPAGTVGTKVPAGKKREGKKEHRDAKEKIPDVTPVVR